MTSIRTSDVARRARLARAMIAAVALTILSCAHGQAPKGLWLTPRKDSRNQARSDVPGRMTTAPTELWRMPVGGIVSSARSVAVDRVDGALIQVGSNLELRSWTGETLWRKQRLGISTVFHVDDFDHDGQVEALIRTDIRTVVLVDVATGAVLWSWRSDPSTQILQGVLHRTATGLRFICFPGYSLNGYCFDFSGNRENPKLLWQKAFSGKYGAGYGPNVILEDMDGDGQQEIVLSSKIPSVYQAVVDVDTGEITFDVHYNVPDDKGKMWGRPYGLFTAKDLDGDGFPDLVMVCCQVEEYIAVARNIGGRRLEKVWSHFIEKDWPTDRLELRPQVTSVADLRDSGRPELVLGLWDSSAWRTVIIDPLKGFESQRGAIAGCYFWGCYDLNDDGTPEIVVSTETTRRPARVTTLRALDGRTLTPVAELNDAAVFVSHDSPLPPDTHFMATRSNPVFVRTADGFGGILVRRFTNGNLLGTFLWGARKGQQIATRKITDGDDSRIDIGDAGLLLSDAVGRVRRFGPDLQPVGKTLSTTGADTMPLVGEVDGRRELVVALAGGTVVGGTPDLATSGKLTHRWQVAGSLPSLHLDAAGRARVVAVDRRDAHAQAALVYTCPVTPGSRPARIELPQPVDQRAGLVLYGTEKLRFLACLRSGPHTTEFAAYNSTGELLWIDKARGAHPNPPAAADLDGDGREEIISDDHGTLRVYGPEGRVRTTVGGPLYCLPIIGPFGPNWETLILRSSAMSNLVMADTAGKQVWSRPAGAPWRYYRSLAAVGDSTGDGRLTLGVLAEDGLFEFIDTQNGAIRTSLALHEAPNRTPIVAGDVDGDGRDEFLAGFSSGRLVCVAERDGQGLTLWEKQFDAAVVNTIIADVDDDGLAEIVVSTSDGYVRVLQER